MGSSGGNRGIQGESSPTGFLLLVLASDLSPRRNHVVREKLVDYT